MRGQSRSSTPCPTTSGAKSYGTSQADERVNPSFYRPLWLESSSSPVWTSVNVVEPVSAPIPCRLYTFVAFPALSRAQSLEQSEYPVRRTANAKNAWHGLHTFQRCDLALSPYD